MQEIIYNIVLEYTFNQVFKLRSGYFYESLQKGGRKYATIGIWMNYSYF
ncbi:MAG: hypothetical protein ABI045_06075 [Flavobacteriales bacterium]